MFPPTTFINGTTLAHLAKDQSVTPPADAATSAPADPETLKPHEEAVLADLANLWRDHHDRGLKLRHGTGQLLNQDECLGAPNKPQPRGPAVMKAAAARLHVPESELSRMRWFAFLFPAFEKFEAEHPEVKTWTAVRDLLPEWKAAVGHKTAHAEAKEQAEEPAARREAFRTLLRAVTGLKKPMRAVTALTSKQKERLLKELQVVVGLLAYHFGISVHLAKDCGSMGPIMADD